MVKINNQYLNILIGNKKKGGNDTVPNTLNPLYKGPNMGNLDGQSQNILNTPIEMNNPTDHSLSIHVSDSIKQSLKKKSIPNVPMGSIGQQYSDNTENFTGTNPNYDSNITDNDTVTGDVSLNMDSIRPEIDTLLSSFISKSIMKSFNGAPDVPSIDSQLSSSNSISNMPLIKKSIFDIFNEQLGMDMKNEFNYGAGILSTSSKTKFTIFQLQHFFKYSSSANTEPSVYSVRITGQELYNTENINKAFYYTLLQSKHTLHRTL